MSAGADGAGRADGVATSIAPPDNPEPLARLRAQAASRVRDLDGELAAVAESTASSPDDEHDAEGSTVGFERARVGALLDAARRVLGEVDAAWGRVADGTYGRCERCGQPIGGERLEALPAARRCRTCAGCP